MYRYLVFAGANYYPSGPEDFQRAFKNREKAEAYAEKLRAKKQGYSSSFDWVVVCAFDPKTGEFTVGA